MKAKHVPECDLAYQKVQFSFLCTSVYSNISLVYSRISLRCLVVGSVHLRRGRFLTLALHSIGAGSRLLGLENRIEDGPKSHGLSV